jgi:hypothetical protein
MPAQTSISDQIREYVRSHYVEPARRAKHARFSVRCGTVQKELGMSNRIAQICIALNGPEFLDPNGLQLVEKSCPPSGTSTAVVYTYEFLNARATPVTSPVPVSTSIFEELLQMEGVLKKSYKQIGGAERAIREQREGYSR